MHILKILRRHFVRNSQHWQSNCITCSKIFFSRGHVIQDNLLKLPDIQTCQRRTHTCLGKKSIYLVSRNNSKSLSKLIYAMTYYLFLRALRGLLQFSFYMGSSGRTKQYDMPNTTARILFFIPARVVFLIPKNRLSLKAQGLLYIPPQKKPTFCPQNVFTCFPQESMIISLYIIVFRKGGGGVRLLSDACIFKIFKILFSTRRV
jgi:hypothetical protein